MNLILKILKKIAKVLVTILILLLLSGLCYRMFSSAPIPPGQLVEVNGTKLHIRAEGQKNHLPTLILEAGAGASTDMLHWVAEGLKPNMRVIRYDREGKGYSHSSKTVMTPESYAHQLHELLEKNGEQPPYILVGHSMGGPYNRIFRDLYPNDVEGIVFIDASHPEQWQRLAQNELIPDEHLYSIKIGALLADLGILGLFNEITGSKPKNDGLPEECHARSNDLSAQSGKMYHRYLQENDINKDILLRAGQSKSLDSLPVLVFSATEQYRTAQKEKYRSQGIDPEAQVQLWLEMQKELNSLSSNSKHVIMDANHGSIITKKENADRINKAIQSMAEDIAENYNNQ